MSNFFTQRAWKFQTELIEGFARIFDGIVQKSGNCPGLIAYQTIQKGTDPAAVGLKIRLTAQPFLPGMDLLSPTVSLGDGGGASNKFTHIKFGLQPRTNFLDFAYLNHTAPVSDKKK